MRSTKVKEDVVTYPSRQRRATLPQDREDLGESGAGRDKDVVTYPAARGSLASTLPQDREGLAGAGVNLSERQGEDLAGAEKSGAGESFGKDKVTYPSRRGRATLPQSREDLGESGAGESFGKDKVTYPAARSKALACHTPEKIAEDLGLARGQGEGSAAQKKRAGEDLAGAGAGEGSAAQKKWVGEGSAALGSHDNFSRSNYALMFTHGISNVVSVFVSVFLVSYIYQISNNYVVDIALFYASKFFVMGLVYLAVSFLLDHTNRVIIYRIALIFHGIFMLIIVIFGRNLASLILLAGSIYGIADALYWASYNLMKNELVPKKLVNQNSMVQYLFEKLMTIIIPITLGKIIDAGSFRTSAIVVLALMAVQFVSSLFIRSKRPQNSSFKLKEFFLDMKNLGENKKFIDQVFWLSAVHGFYTMVAPLETLVIMFSLGSNFSLGALKSLFAAVAIVSLLLTSKLFKFGKKTPLFVASMLICPAVTILMVCFTNNLTLIVYGIGYAFSAIIAEHSFDVVRNSLIKRFKLYHDIAEYQCMVEVIMEFARTLCFLLLFALGVVAARLGQLVLVSKIALAVSVLSISVVDLVLINMEKKLSQKGIM